MSISNGKWWHALNLCLGPNSWKLSVLADRLGGPEAVFRLPAGNLAVAGLPDSLVRSLAANRAGVDPDAEWDRLRRAGIQAITQEDPAYPPRLKEIASAPPLIYIRGDAAALSGDCLAVVGSRKLTAYGRRAVEALVPPLAAMGVTVVSGMAMGADAAALAACLDSGGRPVAVLATSLDYGELGPRSNWHLARRIEKAGCLVSENPPGRPAFKIMFPQRNRIISGLSQGVIIAEAVLASGSLITARLALEQNREVFAVPGSIFSAESAGTLELIKHGAKCVTSAQDVAQEFGWDLPARGRQVPLDDPAQAAVAQALGQEPMSVQDIVAGTGLSAGAVLAALSGLELCGLAKPAGPGFYVKIM